MDLRSLILGTIITGLTIGCASAPLQQDVPKANSGQQSSPVTPKTYVGPRSYDNFADLIRAKNQGYLQSPGALPENDYCEADLGVLIRYDTNSYFIVASPTSCESSSLGFAVYHFNPADRFSFEHYDLRENTKDITAVNKAIDKFCEVSSSGDHRELQYLVPFLCR